MGGGKSRLYTQADGEVERTSLDPDSIPVPDETRDYLIGFGDVMDIEFLYNEKYTRRNIVVRPDGRISYPLAGEISAAGLTIAELKDVITEKFTEILVNPQVTIIIKDFQPQVVYVLGEVIDPKGVNYHKGMTLMGVLSEGGIDIADARKSNILVIRKVSQDHVVGMEIDVDEIIEGMNYSLDVPLEPFDIVYVPRSRIASLEQFVNRMVNIIGGPADLYLKGWQIAHAKTLYEFYSRTGRQ
jgi:polysaccharide export outer membrane protein